MMAVPHHGTLGFEETKQCHTPSARRRPFNAVKKSDLEAAKSRWTISGDDTCGALNVVVGM